MRRPAILTGCMKIPVELISLPTQRRRLTYSYTPMGERESVKVQGYRLDGDFLCVPRQYGLQLCNQLQLPFEDHTTLGSAIGFPRIPTPLDYQLEPLQQLERAFDDYYDVLFRAHTGWGKTIGALIVAARLGRSIAVIVDQENLKDQWIEVLTNPKLFAVDRSLIGEVQGDKCNYAGKLVTVCMVQTLVQRDFDEEFYGSFGTVIGDEVHTLGAPTFSQILLQFSAAYRMFVSATPKRKDGLQRALDYNCGPVRVAADKVHDENAVYVLRNETVYSWYANISPKVGRIINEVADDGARNLMIAEAAKWLVESGRPTIIFSDRVEHLKNIQCLLQYMGVEEEEIGIYAGYDLVWRYDKDPTPKRLPRGLHSWGRERRVYAPYTPIKLTQKQKKIPKAKLDKVKSTCSYILATFGKFSKGVDEPRLAGGVDATPRSAAEQTHGRALREQEGKLQPIWVTIVDINSYRLLFSFGNRVNDYLKDNAHFYEWDGQEGLELWNAQELKGEVNDRVALIKPQEIKQDHDTGLHRLTGKSNRQSAADEIRERFSKPNSPSVVSSRNAGSRRR